MEGLGAVDPRSNGTDVDPQWRGLELNKQTTCKEELLDTQTLPMAAPPSEPLGGQACTVQCHLEDRQQPDHSRGQAF